MRRVQVPSVHLAIPPRNPTKTGIPFVHPALSRLGEAINARRWIRLALLASTINNKQTGADSQPDKPDRRTHACSLARSPARMHTSTIIRHSHTSTNTPPHTYIPTTHTHPPSVRSFVCSFLSFIRPSLIPFALLLPLSGLDLGYPSAFHTAHPGAKVACHFPCNSPRLLGLGAF